MSEVKKEDPSDEKKDGAESDDKATTNPQPTERVRAAIKFKTKFDVVELDASGRVIDKGKQCQFCSEACFYSFLLTVCSHESFVMCVFEQGMMISRQVLCGLVERVDLSSNLVKGAWDITELERRWLSLLMLRILNLK